MRRSAILATALVLTIILVMLTALGASGAANVHRSAAQSNPTPPPPPLSGTPIIGTPTTTGGPSFRKLSQAQRTKITHIFQSDRTFLRLIGHRHFKTTSVWLWTNREGVLLGGVVVLRLPHPVTMSGTWLDLDYDCSEQTSPPYGRVPYKAKYSSVTTITLFVDLQRKQVAGIRPLGVLVGKATYPANYKSRAQQTCPS